MTSAKRNEAISAASKNLPPHTLNLRLMFEIIDELSHIILGSKWKRCAWRILEAQGSDLSGNLFASRASREPSCQYLGEKASAFLQMSAVVVDREPKLA
jgi:hypothetical protein